MLLKLNKIPFARNHAREEEISNVFNKTYNGITNLMPFIATLFFAPALITSSLFSKEIFLMFANISLCMGYLSNFAYRLYRNEISKSELFISIIILALVLNINYFFYPVIMLYPFINTLSFLNQMAAAANIFFLTKHVIIPPFMHALGKMAQFFGCDISAHYYSKPKLTLEHDRHVIDKLLSSTYGHDSFSPAFEEKKIDVFNRALEQLCAYINKYDESFLGYLFNKESIADLESQINKLTIEGNTDSSYTFIKKKISFKTTKIKLLEAARKEVIKAIENPQKDARPLLRFFLHTDEHHLKRERNAFLAAGAMELHNEICRQNTKISLLTACLPSL